MKNWQYPRQLKRHGKESIWYYKAKTGGSVHVLRKEVGKFTTHEVKLTKGHLIKMLEDLNTKQTEGE